MEREKNKEILLMHYMRVEKTVEKMKCICFIYFLLCTKNYEEQLDKNNKQQKDKGLTLK
jgi:hypothetical protein